MDYYCVGCNRSVDGHRYDVVVGRCNRCTKKYKKRTRTIDRIMEHYSDVQAGCLMWWRDKLVLVMEKNPNGWTVRDLKTQDDFVVVVNGHDTFEMFTRIFRENKEDER